MHLAILSLISTIKPFTSTIPQSNHVPTLYTTTRQQHWWPETQATLKMFYQIVSGFSGRNTSACWGQGVTLRDHTMQQISHKRFVRWQGLVTGYLWLVTGYLWVGTWDREIRGQREPEKTVWCQEGGPTPRDNENIPPLAAVGDVSGVWQYWVPEEQAGGALDF